MTSIGMTRRIDALGRIVVPAELRRVLEIRVGDLLDIRVDDGHLVLAKVERTCVFCTSAEGLNPFRDKLVCVECIERLAGAGAAAVTSAGNDGDAHAHATEKAGAGAAAVTSAGNDGDASQSPGAEVGAGDGSATASS
jgi:AbrB family transcriptional regulator, transcriptional pleiotropic regulator of transition state genes